MSESLRAKLAAQGYQFLEGAPVSGGAAEKLRGDKRKRKATNKIKQRRMKTPVPYVADIPNWEPAIRPRKIIETRWQNHNVEVPFPSGMKRTTCNGQPVLEGTIRIGAAPITIRILGEIDDIDCTKPGVIVGQARISQSIDLPFRLSAERTVAVIATGRNEATRWEICFFPTKPDRMPDDCVYRVLVSYGVIAVIDHGTTH